MTFYKSLTLGLLVKLPAAIKLAHPHTDEEFAAAGLANCRCLDSNGIEPMEGTDLIRVYTAGNCTPLELPANYGTQTCESWFLGIEEMGCGGENPHEICAQPWCYVDPSCEAEDARPSSFNTDVSFSLLACGAEMTLAENPNARSQEECAAEEAAAMEAAAQAAAAA